MVENWTVVKIMLVNHYGEILYTCKVGQSKYLCNID